MTWDRHAWRAGAVCARLDPADVDRVFFGTWLGHRGQRYEPGAVEEARAVCDACPVWAECLRAALAAPDYLDRVGIVAGLLPEERATLRATGEVPVRDGAMFVGGRPDDGRTPRKPRPVPVGRIVA